MASRSAVATLEALATQYEQDAAAIRTTLAILTRRKETRAVEALPAKLATAIRGERQKKATGAVPSRDHKPTPPKLSKTAQRRSQTQEVLALFHEERPSTPKTVRALLVANGLSVYKAAQRMKIIGALVRHGHLKKVGAHEYTRTARTFSVNGSHASA